MSEPATAFDRMSVAEFLAWNPPGDTRYDLVDGRPVMMAPPKEAHGTIATNLAVALSTRLRRPCRLVQQAGVLVDLENDRYYEADMAVTCAPPKGGRQWIEEPRLIVEILSPSTKEHDVGEKAERYRFLPSVEELLLVSSVGRHVIHWRREIEGWHVQDVIGRGAARLGLTEDPLDLDTVYADVVFAED